MISFIAIVFGFVYEGNAKIRYARSQDNNCAGKYRMYAAKCGTGEQHPGSPDVLSVFSRAERLPADQPVT
jgi:hypothetical protein